VRRLVAYVDDETADKLEALAKEQMRPVSQMIAVLLVAALAQTKGEQ
jgi:hypothetical protein